MRFRKRKADPQPTPAESLQETLTEGDLIVNGISDEQLERIVKEFSAFVSKSDKAFDRFWTHHCYNVCGTKLDLLPELNKMIEITNEFNQWYRENRLLINKIFYNKHNYTISEGFDRDLETIKCVLLIWRDNLICLNDLKLKNRLTNSFSNIVYRFYTCLVTNTDYH